MGVVGEEFSLVEVVVIESVISLLSLEDSVILGTLVLVIEGVVRVVIKSLSVE